MNSLLLISPDRGSGFKPILFGKFVLLKVAVFHVNNAAISKKRLSWVTSKIVQCCNAAKPPMISPHLDLICCLALRWVRLLILISAG